MLHEKKLFWQNLNNIRDSLLLEDEEFAVSLGLKYDQYLKMKINSNFLPLNCVFELAEKMNFHFEDLLTQDFKINHLKALAPGESAIALDQRYSYGTYSGIQPINNIINYIETTRGLRAKINIIRKFQLSDDFFNDRNQKINIFLITDIVNYLNKTYVLKPSDFISMGQRTPFASKGTILSEKLAHQENVHDVLSCFFDECVYLFDNNYKYTITKMTKDYAIIDGNPLRDVISELKINAHQLGNEEVCLTKMGVLSSLTYFKYEEFTPVRKISSVHDGQLINRYLLNIGSFRNSRPPSHLSLAHL